MSGVLFEVKATWASKGRMGETSHIVRAADAIQALKSFWETEDAKQLRNVEIRWLAPADCVHNGLPQFCEACEEELNG